MSSRGTPVAAADLLRAGTGRGPLDRHAPGAAAVLAGARRARRRARDGGAGAAPDRYAGLASGINNAVARTGSLLAIAALPTAVGLTGADYRRPAVFTAGYAEAMLVCTVLLLPGGVVSCLGLGPGPARRPR